jgi:hypothetical protein
MGCDLRDRPRRSGRRQLRGAAAADHEPLLDDMRQDALRRAHLGDLDPAKLSPEVTWHAHQPTVTSPDPEVQRLERRLAVRYRCRAGRLRAPGVASVHRERQGFPAREGREPAGPRQPCAAQRRDSPESPCQYWRRSRQPYALLL